MNLFVYGTLRRGGGLSSRMDLFECLGTFKTWPLYAIYDQGCPILTDGIMSVTGEIYVCNLNDIQETHQMELACGYELKSIYITLQPFLTKTVPSSLPCI